MSNWILGNDFFFFPTLNKGGLLLKSLFTFGKECFMTQRKWKKNSGRIPVQSTARSKRRIKHRGAGTSISGRPTKEQSIRVQLQVNEEEDFVSFQIPSRNKAKQVVLKKDQNPHPNFMQRSLVVIHLVHI